jgi:hypothetical protein
MSLIVKRMTDPMQFQHPYVPQESVPVVGRPVDVCPSCKREVTRLDSKCPVHGKVVPCLSLVVNR